MKLSAKKAILHTAVLATVGISPALIPSTALALTVDFAFEGLFTMLNPAGNPLANSDFASETNYYGWRTPVSGTLSFDPLTLTGTATITPFSFSGGGLAVTTTVTVEPVGLLPSPSLLLGNMGFNWSGNNGIPVSIVLDAQGLLSCLPALPVVGQVCTGLGARPESENTRFGTGMSTYTLPIGFAPIVTTDWNTTPIGNVTLGTNPSGGLPLVVDTAVDSGSTDLLGEIGIGGSPMGAGPFPGWNANFDFTSLTVIGVTVLPPVPVPAALWLFGSGIIGLIGIARRNSTTRMNS
jgi:hypothetical protein